MYRCIISTVGTSLLTNQIDRNNPSEKLWYSKLRDMANLAWEQLSFEVQEIIKTLEKRAQEKLREKNFEKIRRASAELNGLFGLYENFLSYGKQDTHFLVATDTAQGRVAADLVKNFLINEGIVNVNTYIPTGLNTASTIQFSEGIDELIVWLQKEIAPNFQENYRIIFNLVGSFKALQGYLNTIGMFYAHEVVYIFEGEGSDVITIPRLPIQVDIEGLRPHTLQLVFMDVGGNGLSSQETQDIPEALIGECDNRKILSTWGRLVWNECKETLLSGELLSFPWLEYADSFRRDYKQIRQTQECFQLQEQLARVSYLLKESQGDTSVLFQNQSIQYDPYEGTKGIDHFRVSKGWRISCQRKNGGGITLYHYGTHDYVQKKELKD
ncbi:CRISPR-associated protein, APE2256 family [Halothece sp. PCC 7418]|uniref:putative CRISPR-associated protein n=1 Tax=Halothece sp. (strain PCC 7418) TaxID=65093 RepID=UPI0002A07CAE|nr:putative CRISPR-associated protein [Halothece sp. PCC 7418]AFZ42903.1 CRISPR-associated protein, APE2256 family [Halothece sp. PCC 7418]